MSISKGIVHRRMDYLWDSEWHADICERAYCPTESFQPVRGKLSLSRTRRRMILRLIQGANEIIAIRRFTLVKTLGSRAPFMARHKRGERLT